MEDDNTNVNYFKLDKDFINAEYCSIFDLYTLLKDKNTKMSKGVNPQMDQVFTKTMQYVERFNKFGFPESAERAGLKALELRNILKSTRANFTRVEKAQIMDLLPQKAEEAFALIPSLKEKLQEDEMQYFLDQLHKKASSIIYDNTANE